MKARFLIILACVGVLISIPHAFASESQVIRIFQPDVEVLPNQKIDYGQSFTIHAWLQSYENRPDGLGFYVNVLDPKHNQVDSTLWFAKSDFIYEFDTAHNAYNITQSGTYYVKLEKANFHERIGIFPKTISFEILYPEPEPDMLIPENCGPGTTLQDGICVVNSENADRTTNAKWRDTFDEKHSPPLKQVKFGIPLHAIQCNGERTLIWQKDTLKPACVFHESELIFERKWAKLRIGMPAEEITQEKLCLWYSDNLPKYLAPYCGLTSKSNPYVVEIPFEQSIQYEDLELYFYDVEDSRCPTDVTCIWEGQVTAMIHVKNQTHKISGYFTPNLTVNYITPYNVTLVDIQPHPVSTEKPDYVVTLEIKKLE